MEHVKLFWNRLNIPTLLTCCQQNQHWKEVVFLYAHYDQYDNAVNTMMERSTDCWTHEDFKDKLKKVGNTDIYYRAINFYLNEKPLLLNDLLLDLANQLDPTRVVNQIRAVDHLALIQKYLLHVQRENIAVVNDAVNNLYLQEENYKGLRESVDLHDLRPDCFGSTA